MNNLGTCERVELGLTLTDCGNILAKVRAAHDDFDDRYPQDQAILFMQTWLELATKKLSTIGDERADRWDRIFSFIERFLPLILRIFAL